MRSLSSCDGCRGLGTFLSVQQSARKNRSKRTHIVKNWCNPDINVQNLLKHLLWTATVRKKCFASNRFAFSCHPINDSMTHTSYPLTFSTAKHFPECLVIEHISRKVQIFSSCIKPDYFFVCKCQKWFRAVYCRLCVRLCISWRMWLSWLQ